MDRSLRLLNVNQRARIVVIRSPGEIQPALRDMGLIPGSLLTDIGRAP